MLNIYTDAVTRVTKFHYKGVIAHPSYIRNLNTQPFDRLYLHGN